VTVLDVRPEDEYAAGHLPRSIQYSATRAVRRLRKLPKSREIVAYCRVPTAFWHLRPLRFFVSAAGRFDAWRMDFRNWKAAGLPVVECVAGQ